MKFIPRKLEEALTLSKAAKLEKAQDSRGLSNQDLGIKAVVQAGVEWICRAQDCSKPNDGGVARHFSLIDGWSASYPETTGYIIPTLLEYYDLTGNEKVRERARKMTDWLVSIQFSEGGFPGGKIGDEPIVPVTFNTGQILFGLTYAQKYFSQYENSVRIAADWLVNVQDEDGCWRKYESPFAKSGEKVYDTHISWALLEASSILNERQYYDAALKQIRWAISQQHDNGWFDKCCLDDVKNPLTHTIGYTLRGILEAYKFSREKEFLNAAIKCADPIIEVMDDNGRLPGRLNANWYPAVNWVCLTGLVQIAYCWLMLYGFTEEEKYKKAGFRANKYVRKTIEIDKDINTHGAVKGSFPVDGDYGRFQYLNWAVKFMIDSNIFEGKLKNLFLDR